MYIEQHSRYQNKANNIQLRYDDKQFHTTVIKDVLGFAPIFPDICYHLTHYKPAAADIPVASADFFGL